MTLTTGIERIRIRNYRVLRDVELDGLTPVTVLIGPNGSGKSTVLDAIDFVFEAVTSGLAEAWGRRGGLAGILSRDAGGPVEIELGSRLWAGLFVYHLVIGERDSSAEVLAEKLSWRSDEDSEAFDLLDIRDGRGTVHRPGVAAVDEQFTAPDILGADTFGRFAANVEIAAFRRFAARVRLAGGDAGRLRLPSAQDSVAVLLTDGPETGLYPLSHASLADDIRAYAETSQVIAATHSPGVVNASRLDEVWMVHRDGCDRVQVQRAADLPRLVAMAGPGALLGDLWLEGFFDVGDPLARRQ
ncbi:AAA family ATPase [Amycolatopsis sp. NPDC051061]|uniref:AAA family ATPase n=1 Tax=Amycolatopsis sp. NPDC051061 TaxID=3155042 RepID=UPI0034220D7D